MTKSKENIKTIFLKQLKDNLTNKSGTSAWTREVMNALNNCEKLVKTNIEDKKYTTKNFDEPIPFHHCPGTVKEGQGEYLVDFSLANWPDFRDKTQDKEKGYGILLAAESEWGKQDSLEGNYIKVLNDFCKLVDVKAPVKILVFSYHLGGRENISGIESFCKKFGSILSNHHWVDLDRESYFFIGIPWGDWKMKDIEENFCIFEANKIGNTIVIK